MARNASGMTMAAVNLPGVSPWAAAALDVAGDEVVLVVELGAKVAGIKEGVGIEVGSGSANVIGLSSIGALVVSAAEGFS